jgi:outer membrane protein assembly factor BamB
LRASLLLACTLAAPAADWPAWRGPGGQGHSAETDLPLTWSPTENVRWKAPLPDEGNSTPIVSGQRVFLTQATKLPAVRLLLGGVGSASLGSPSSRELWCLARATGKVLWRRQVVYTEQEPTHATNPYCSASPVSDGERVVVSHGSAGMFCYDFSGKELWRKDLGKLHHIWGNASSPILHRDLAILWCGPGDRQFLLAVDKRTGKEVWRHDEPGGKSGAARPWVGSWSTPLVVHTAGRDELLLGVPGKFKAFDPATGKELWSCDGLVNKNGDELVYASPVYAGGIAVAMGGFHGGALAVRTGGKGDVTRTHRLWYDPASPQRIGSPVLVGEHLYIVNDSGLAQCLDLKTGLEVWQKPRLTGSTWGSMVAAGGRLYVTSRDGETVVLAAGPKFKLLAKNHLREPVYASVTVSGGELFIRSYKHLWCIGAGR